MATGRTLSRRDFVIGAGAAAASLPFLDLTKAFGADKRPNFVFILTDDQRWDAMSCAGHPFLRTPNMDRIAKEGARFTNAFATTALCAPSRGSFHTGMCVHTHGVKDNGTQWPDKIPTYSQLLQQARYDTAFIGKWHMDMQDGPRPGFNRWVSFQGQGVYWNPVLNVDGEKVVPTGYMTDLLTEYAVDWLRKPRNGPFSLCLWHKAVHGPFEPPVRYSKLYSDCSQPQVESLNDTLADKPSWTKTKKAEPVAANPPQNPNRKTREQSYLDYCRTIVGVDDSVGRILKTLEETGVLDDTVVIFAGDNGYLWGEHGQGDKRVMYEESIRIPLLMRYPKLVKPKSLCEDIVLNIDVAPTILDLAGAAIPEKTDGRSWRPILKGNSRGWRTDFLYEYDLEQPYVRKPTVRGIRNERWKYIEYPDFPGEYELYDIKNDPHEMHNLINDPRCADVLARMRSRFRELMTRAGYEVTTK